MFRKFSFWLWGLVTVQLLTAAIHTLSFFVEPEAANETEKQLHELVNNYKKDMGLGITRSFADVFLSLSICFTLLCLLGGLINWYLKKKQISNEIWKGLLLIETIVFGILLVEIVQLTFLPPMIFAGLIFIFSLGSYLSVKPKS